MKKVLFSLYLMAFASGLMAQGPVVTITPGTPGTTTVPCSFAKNEACSRYKILIAEPGIVEMYAPMFGGTAEAVIDSWGLELLQDTTYTWTEQTPATQYVIYALAFGDSLNAIFSDTITTASAGGHGESVITLNVTNIGDTCATTSAIPNDQTMLFKDLMIEKGAFDTIPTDTIKGWLIADYYVHYETYNWVWLTLRPSTDYIYCSMGMNADSVWGDMATFQFATTGSSHIASSAAANIAVYPNPATDHVNVSGIPSDAEVRLLDLQGRELLRSRASESGCTLPLQGLAPGTYCLQLFSAPATRPFVRTVVVSSER